MPDPISAAAGIIGLARTLGDLLAKIKDKSVRSEFQEKLFQLQGEALRLQEENAGLRDENRKLKEVTSDRVNPADYQRLGNAYWKRADNTGPYCVKCLENDHRERGLLRVYPGMSAGICATCQTRHGAVFPKHHGTPVKGQPHWPWWTRGQDGLMTWVFRGQGDAAPTVCSMEARW